MDDSFALGNFIARAMPWTRHDLSSSESASIPLLELLALADSEDSARWQHLELGYAAPRGAGSSGGIVPPSWYLAGQ